MKDYVIKINDIVPWRVALRAEAEAGSPYAYIDENTAEAKLALPATGILARIGNSTASICRLNTEQHEWLTGLAQVVELGHGSPYIKTLDDVTWTGSGKGLYHAIHLQTPYDVDDGEGGSITRTPPELHCVIAS